ncbi:MAG: potassium transporter Kup [Bdellovibrionaceae bacterium]|nr:potassium transporter Kup [Bdellovibrio sp.]
MSKNTSSNQPQNNRSPKYKYLLALGALGVVYGDIGTSPLYALKDSFLPGHHVLANPENILSLLSLIFWSLMIVISLKYLAFILRADNRGEGGILALTSLIAPQADHVQNNFKRSKNFLVLLGLFGTALLYGDGMITPAISILSAVEGLELITPIFNPYIIPITISILIGLFAIQRHGTSAVGKIFGPVTLVWFFVLALLGVVNIIDTPEVFRALNPMYVITYFQNNTWHGFVALGSVFLVVTGGEALYSDLGHFGRAPIKLAWFWIVLPSLVLNYFGQGALLMRNPAAISNPFYLMAPSWALYPLVILAAISTTIASQALITGVFSLTMQAVQHGYAPRLRIAHTSKDEIGQIYVQSMNRLLMIGSIALVLSFKTSSNLAAAYGFAVTTTMVITTILFYVFARKKWKWSVLKAGSLCAVFLTVDLGFWSANLLKIIDGGWFPLLIGIAGFTFMTTWKTGRQLLKNRLSEKIIPLKDFLDRVANDNPHRAEGTAVYLNRNLNDTPYALVHSYEHFKTVHKHLIFLAVQTEESAHIEEANRVLVEKVCGQNYRIVLRYGYLEQPNVPRDIDQLMLGDVVLDIKQVTFIVGKENLFATEFPGMAIWREKFFSLMAKNELPATDYFQLPRSRVLEIGVQIEI